MAIWTFVRLTLREASRSRLLALAGVLTLAFLGLIAWGMSKINELSSNVEGTMTSGIGLEVFAFFVGSFMLTLLAVFVCGQSTHQEADSGLLQAIVAKPVRRFDLVAGRWLGSAVLLALWVALFTAGLVLAVGLQTGYYPPHPVLAAGLLLLQGLVILSLRLLFGAFLGTLASGIVPLMLYGFAWMGGMVETVGQAIKVPSMVSGGIVTSLILPTDAVWRGASYDLLPAVSTFITSAFGLGNPTTGMPFVGLSPIAGPMLVWALGYTLLAFWVAARVFAKRDI